MRSPAGNNGGVRRPTIGVTPDAGITRPDAQVFEVKGAHADAVLRAGGLPLTLAAVAEGPSIDGYLSRVSGLLVTGGDPQGAFEAVLVKAALARGIPVLGVGAGMQLLNAVLGGTSFEDLPQDLPAAKEHSQRHDPTHPQHPIDVKDGTLLGEALGRGPLMVNSSHRQAVRAVGEGVRVNALAPDGVIEGIESSKHGFAVAVQWHPELLIHTVPPHLGLYKAFVAKARELRR